MSTLVTGATGFVGSRIAAAFAAQGRDVKLTSRRPHTDDGRKFWRLPDPGDADKAFDALMDGVEHVVHCAAMNNDAVGATDAEFHLANALLTRKLAEAASRNVGGRFLYLSSSHATPTDDPNIRETSKTTAYGRSKGAGELAVRDCLSGQHGGSFAILRLPTVYGVGMRNRLAQLLRIARLPIPLPITGLEKRHTLVSCDAVADAALHLIFHAGSLQPIYFAGDAKAVSIPEIIGAFREGLGRRKLMFRIPGSRAIERKMHRSRQQSTHTAANSPSLLVNEGWTPETETLKRLCELAQSARTAQLL